MQIHSYETKIDTHYWYTFFSLLSFGQNEPLFRIIQNGKVGYINKDGDIVIQPQFLVGGEFSSGLAAVRKKGLFGYNR